jgi:hypothetical protein
MGDKRDASDREVFRFRGKSGFPVALKVKQAPDLLPSQQPLWFFVVQGE